jgi:hypothetical protein
MYNEQWLCEYVVCAGLTLVWFCLSRFAHTSVGGSINNALCISEHLGGTRLLISNNDETIKVYSLPGLQRLTSIQLPTAVNYGMVCRQSLGFP